MGKKITMKDILEVLLKNNFVVDYSKEVNLSDYLVENLSYNSTEVSKNTLFMCKGLNFKSEYLESAIKNGSSGYISEIKYMTEAGYIPYIKVNDIRKSMSVVAQYFYEYAYREINLIGITGTKGKTTTTNYLKNILDEHEKNKTAYISTMHIYTKTTDKDNHLTTPESLDLQKYFYETKQNNIKYLTMEVSSQAYKVDRVFGMKFNVGVFLNISEDHISPIEHPSFEDYLNCKLQLLKNCDVAVINYDTDYLDSLLDASKEASQIITFGSTNKADYYISSITNEERGYSFVVKSDKYSAEEKYVTQIQGRFNIENALAAICVAKSLNIDSKSIYDGILKTEVLGRMTIIKKNNITVIVDYAHNKLSFEKLFETVKLDYPNDNVSIVFGCPGNKAYTRRKDLGETSAKNCDKIYLTADDPQKEKVLDICKDVATYIEKQNGKYEIIEDRCLAIKKALEEAKKTNGNQVVILAGKGSETTQKVNGKLEDYEGDIYWANEYLNYNK